MFRILKNINKYCESSNSNQSNAKSSRTCEVAPHAVCKYKEINDGGHNSAEIHHWKVQNISQAAIAIIAALTLGAAITAACYTKKQWETAYEQERLSLRAYITLTNAELQCPRCDDPANLSLMNIVPKTPPTKPIPFPPGANIILKFENSGLTPGYDIDENVTIRQVPKSALIEGLSLPDDFDFVEIPDRCPQTHTVISKDSPVVLFYPVSPVMVMNILGREIPEPRSPKPAEDAALFVYGHFSYTDIFKIRHTTLFCIGYTPETQWRKASWGFCSKHNEHD